MNLFSQDTSQDPLPPVSARLALLKHLHAAYNLERLMPISQTQILQDLLGQLRAQVPSVSLWSRLGQGWNTQRQAEKLLRLYCEAAQYAWWAHHKEVIPELLSLAEAAWAYTRQSYPCDRIRTDFARFTQAQHKQRFHEALQQLQDT